MNQNFVGKADAEDIKVMEGLRRGLLPLIAVMENLKREMMMRQDGPPDWSSVQRITTALTSHLATIQSNINGREASELTGLDAVIASAPKAQALHPYPMAPFPVEQANLVNLANVLLRKKIEPREEKWVEERLAKAAQFAHVPPEWGIEPKKVEAKDSEKERQREREIHDNDSIDIIGDEEMEDDALGKLTREKGALDEDQLMQMWNRGSGVSVQEYAVWQEAAYDKLAEEGRSYEGLPISPEDEQMEDADGSKTSAGVGAQKAMPMMPLAAMHRFMSIGAVN